MTDSNVITRLFRRRFSITAGLQRLAVKCLQLMVVLASLQSELVIGSELSRYVSAALEFDPTLKSSGAQRDATMEQRAQGRSQLLPQLSFQQSTAHNITEQSPIPANGLNSRNFDYPSNSKSLIVRQALFRPRQTFNAMQGNVKAQLGEAQFQITLQKTIGKAVSAYAGYLVQSENQMASAEEQVAAEIRLRQTEMLRQAGEVSDVELMSARSNLVLARARLREATANLVAARRDLAAMVGTTPLPQAPEIDWRAAAERLLSLVRSDILLKTELDLDYNPEVLAQQLAVEVAGFEVKKAASDHSPTIDLVASVSEGTSAQDIAVNLFTRTRSVGVQLNVPLFSGGMTQSSVRENVAMRDKATYDLEATRLRIENDRSRTLDEIGYRLDLLEAGLADLKSAAVNWQQAEQGLRGGTHNDADTADRRAKLQRSRAGLARYATDAIVSYVQHLVSLGVADVEMVGPISAALAAK